MAIEVLDDFISEEYYKPIVETTHSKESPWFYNFGKVLLGQTIVLAEQVRDRQ